MFLILLISIVYILYISSLTGEYSWLIYKPHTNNNTTTNNISGIKLSLSDMECSIDTTSFVLSIVNCLHWTQ